MHKYSSFLTRPLHAAMIAAFFLCSCATPQPATVIRYVAPLEPTPPQTVATLAKPLELPPAETIIVQEDPVQEQVEEQTPPEPEQTAAQEVKDLETLGPWDEKAANLPPQEEQHDSEPPPKLYDFPVTINRQVEYYLDFFQHRHRKSFRRWLARSGRYLPMIKANLRAAKIPEDLAYLPMIESGYSLTAYSRARAVGPWQFIRSTAVHYGLTVNHYVDERRDPLKSTQAACRYLADLHKLFNSWPLAVAAYNAGEGKINKAIKRYKTHDFWEIAKHSYLKSETKRYVPKLTAAIIIANNPEKYGFTDLKYDQPLAYDTVGVPPWTSLRAVALACKTDFKTIQNLNRHLRQSITPPSSDTCEIKIPLGKKDLLAESLPRVMVSTSTHFKTHIIRRHDTIRKICRKYRISKTTLLKANNLHKAKLRPGRHLRIPYRETKYTLLSREEFNQQQRLAAAGKDPSTIIHKVKAGETVSKIAARYHTSSRMIATWNGLHSINRIKVGQKLAIHLGAQNSVARNVYYNVRHGDSLWTIARKFNTNTNNIKHWNNLKNNLIHPGLRLILKRAQQPIYADEG